MLTRYLIDKGPTLSNPENIIGFCKNLSRYWGDLNVSKINTMRCNDYAEHRRQEFMEYQLKRYGRITRNLSDHTIRRELDVLKAALNFDYQENRLSEVPHVTMPKKPPARNRWLTHKEAARLLKEARRLENARYYLPLFILIGLYTAARKEAILGLRWSDIDFERGYIDFGEGNKVKRRSKVPIPKRLMRELRRAKQTDIGPVIHQGGFPIKNIRNSFVTVCKNAGLEDVRPHTLRHTAISWMVQKDISYSKISKWAGATVGMIERVYGHLAPEHLSDIREAYG